MVYKNLKFASGEKEMVQKDILIIQYSLVIGLYKEACKNVNYDALSDSSLWYIQTEAIKAKVTGRFR